eukprot:1873599-Pyramimonas_sp.AAC.1
MRRIKRAGAPAPWGAGRACMTVRSRQMKPHRGPHACANDSIRSRNASMAATNIYLRFCDVVATPKPARSGARQCLHAR